MKKTIFTFFVVILTTGTTFISCKSSSEKEAAAETKVQDAKQNLKDVVAASAEEFKAFKNESEVKISNNESRIAELKLQMEKSGKTLDGIYKKTITTLEEKNNDLKKRIDTYETSPSNWELFKREFSHDIDGLGQALKDFAIDNKK